MKKGLLSGVAMGALLLPAGAALAADPVIIPMVAPVIEIEEEEGPEVTVTLTQTLGKEIGDDELVAETEVEVEVVTARGFGINLNLFHELEFEPGNPPPEFSPGFRLTIFREFDNFAVGVFGGLQFEDIGGGGDRIAELGIAAAMELGPVEVEAEIARIWENGVPDATELEFEAEIGIGEMLTLIPGIGFEFPAGGGAPDIVLALEIEVAIRENFALLGGVEHEIGNGTFVWAGFAIQFGGGD